MRGTDVPAPPKGTRTMATVASPAFPLIPAKLGATPALNTL